jgi:hypothetical protein
MKTVHVTPAEKFFIETLIKLLTAEAGFSDVDFTDMASEMKITQQSAKGLLGSLVKKGLCDIVPDDFAGIIFLSESLYHMHPEWCTEQDDSKKITLQSDDEPEKVKIQHAPGRLETLKNRLSFAGEYNRDCMNVFITKFKETNDLSNLIMWEGENLFRYEFIAKYWEDVYSIYLELLDENEFESDNDKISNILRRMMRWMSESMELHQSQVNRLSINNSSGMHNIHSVSILKARVSIIKELKSFIQEIEHWLNK